MAADPTAAGVGADILRSGGNAVDAVVAAMLAECVVQPHNIGLGGYAGTMILYSAKRDRVFAIDFDSIAPAAASPDMFPLEACTYNWDIADNGSSTGPGLNEYGCLCVTVPPIVAGLTLALEKYGTKSFAEVAGPAQKLAEDGFRVRPNLAKVLSLFAAHADPESIEAVLPAGVPNEGDILVQKDLGALIGRLRQDGPMSFYGGEIRQMILERIRRGGGILDESDFDNVTARVEEPLAVECGEFEVFTPAPPAGGITALQILNVLKEAQLAPTDLGMSRQYTLLIEAARHAWRDRFAYLGDPLCVDVPVEEMLSTRRAREILRQIESGTAPIDIPVSAAGSEHTVHLVAVDKERNMVGVTATHGSWFGSMIAVKGLGLVLGHGLSRFDPVPGGPNSIAPGKRVQHNMSPILIMRGGKPYCTIGMPGGRKIVNGSAVLAHAITTFGLTCGEAMALPRFHVDGSGPVVVDSAVLARQMADSGYPVEFVSKRAGGPVAGALLAHETGLIMAASEAGEACVATV